jgi:ABC-type dipeptide/oligopeptide/nickel transport system permease component
VGRLLLQRDLGARHRHPQLLAGAHAHRLFALALQLRWLPPFGLREWQGYILPVVVIATEEMAVLMRITRGAVLELLPQDFVRTARSKGLAERACSTATSSRTRCCPS